MIILRHPLPFGPDIQRLRAPFPRVGKILLHFGLFYRRFSCLNTPYSLYKYR